MTADQVEGIALKLLNGTAKFIPVTAPLVALIEGILEAVHENGMVTYEMPAAQVQAMAAGMAAARASAITTDRNRRR